MKSIQVASILASACLLITAAGCNAGKERKVEVQNLHNPSPEIVRQAAQKEPSDKSTLSPFPSIGDTPAQLEKVYGQNHGDPEVALYQDDFMIVFYANQRAANILFQFGNYPGGRLNSQQVKKFILDRLPRDSTEIKKSAKSTASQHMTQYYSHSLEETVPAENFHDGEPGMFTVTVYNGDSGSATVAVSLGETKGDSLN